ncbi:ornithine cyclodeaminase family protein [Ornithinimicrobium sp. W1665]|uniref:ornithine cyclodeaminase family protein n=1 Tax=Ornithinimicrobium sp. W1665 TaxID=3416666 RepID=UPI003CF555C2
MRVLDADHIRARVDPGALVQSLREAFAGQNRIEAPARMHLPMDEDLESTLLVMPAWERGRYVGVKVVGHYPRNGAEGLPSILGSYLLLEARTGQPVAVLDATELTPWRTAAASALAADHLGPDQVNEHLVIGAGKVAAAVPACYSVVREVELTRVWARRPERAAALVDQLRSEGRAAEPVADLRAAVRTADVITSATSSTTPLILAEDVRPGAHVDLIGAFSPQMVEADEALVTSAKVFIDGPEALHAGDLAGPLERGTFTETDVHGTLADLVTGRHGGRRAAAEVTLFKSVGSALEDLVAAVLVVEAGDA